MQAANIEEVKTIQIRNVPDDVHGELRSRAAAAGISLSDYALAELERVATQPAIGEVLQRAGARAGAVPSRSEIVAAIRADRGTLG